MSPDENPADDGPARWAVVHEEGPPHGGLFELEVDHYYHVVDRRTGERVLTFEGEYSASFGGSGEWTNGAYSGVTDVRIDTDGRHALVYRGEGEPTRVPLPC